MAFMIDIKKNLYDFQLAVKLQSEEEIIGILGASGSGKSMLLRCIAGLVKPDQGQIIINGKTFFDSQKKNQFIDGSKKGGVSLSELCPLSQHDGGSEYCLWLGSFAEK